VTRRQRQIADLLGAILDAPFAQPHSWTEQLVRRNAKRGESPGRRIPCPNCEGEGWLPKRGIPHGCTRCGGEDVGLIPGSGQFARDSGRGWIEVDDYTERQVGSVRTEVVIAVKVVGCDVCGGSGVTLAERWRGENNRCLRCNGGGRLEVLASHWQASRSRFEAVALERAGDAVLDTMEARARAGSFDELGAALEALRRRWPALFRLVCDTYVVCKDVSLEERHAAEAIGLEFISMNMPDEIKVPGWVRRRRREEAAA